MDSVAAHVILASEEPFREDTRAKVEAENDGKIAKVVWLGNKVSRKAYNSMAVFFSGGEHAIQASSSRILFSGRRIGIHKYT